MSCSLLVSSLQLCFLLCHKNTKWLLNQYIQLQAEILSGLNPCCVTANLERRRGRGREWGGRRRQFKGQTEKLPPKEAPGVVTTPLTKVATPLTIFQSAVGGTLVLVMDGQKKTTRRSQSEEIESAESQPPCQPPRYKQGRCTTQSREEYFSLVPKVTFSMMSDNLSQGNKRRKTIKQNCLSLFWTVCSSSCSNGSNSCHVQQVRLCPCYMCVCVFVLIYLSVCFQETSSMSFPWSRRCWGPISSQVTSSNKTCSICTSQQV